MWATDSSKVQEFMFSYLKDPLREVEQPYFHQDEVTHTFTTTPTPLLLGLCPLMEISCLHKLCVPIAPPPPCIVGVGGSSEIDMDSHDLSLKHLLPHRQKRLLSVAPCESSAETEGCFFVVTIKL